MEVKHLKGLAESYNQVYYNHENFISDLSEICLENFFETYEDSDYFVHQLVEQDLLEEFLFDLSEELDVNISCYLGEDFLLENPAALRGVIGLLRSRGVDPRIVNSFSSAGRAKAGLPQVASGLRQGVKAPSTTTALGRSGEPMVRGTSAASAPLQTTIRTARQAARRSQAATLLPNRYATSLQTRRASTRALPPAGGTTASTPRAVAQRAATAEREKALAAQQAVNQTGTEVRIDQPGASASKSYQYTPPDAGLPFRATGPGGDARIQRLASQAASRSGGPTKPKNTALTTGAAITGIGALTAAATGAALNQKKGRHDPTHHYNTMDPNGRIRDRLAVGPKIVGPKIVGTGSISGDFDAAFKKARTSGKKNFDFKGKKYTTQLASEGNDHLEILVDKLVIEGYVKDYDGAISMINSLDENGLSTLAQKLFES